jgi:hypothetical protein
MKKALVLSLARVAALSMGQKKSLEEVAKVDRHICDQDRPQ